MESGDLDLVLVSDSRIKGVKYKKKPLGTVNYKLFLPKEWEKRVNKKKPLDLIFEESFATIDGQGELRTGIDDLAKKRKKPVMLELECSSLTEAALTVESGYYCSILPDFVGRKLDKEKVVSLPDPRLNFLRRKLCIAWKKSTYSFKPRLDFAIDSICKAFKDAL